MFCAHWQESLWSPSCSPVDIMLTELRRRSYVGWLRKFPTFSAFFVAKAWPFSIEPDVRLPGQTCHVFKVTVSWSKARRPWALSCSGCMGEIGGDQATYLGTCAAGERHFDLTTQHATTRERRFKTWWRPVAGGATFCQHPSLTWKSLAESLAGLFREQSLLWLRLLCNHRGALVDLAVWCHWTQFGGALICECDRLFKTSKSKLSFLHLGVYL